MNITDNTTVVDIELSVIKARYLSDYKIEVLFNDNTKKTVDVGSFLKKANHPAIKKYLDMEKFKKFDIVYGNINWNDYDMIFPIENLYKGIIE